MLAGETAAGAFPVRAVQTLDAIIRDAEASAPRDARTLGGAVTRSGEGDHRDALCEAAVMLAAQSGAQAIVAVTRGGGTARRLSALRPHAPILATTDRDATARRLALYWGVLPLCTDIGENVGAAAALIGEQIVARGLVARGATVVFVSINPDVSRSDANYLKLQRV